MKGNRNDFPQAKLIMRLNNSLCILAYLSNYRMSAGFLAFFRARLTTHHVGSPP